MDTDGYVSKGGNSCEYTTVNPTLAKQVLQLIRSLGYKGALKKGNATINGVFKSYKYRVLFTPHKDDIIFKLERKQNRIINEIKKDRNDKYKLFIKNIEESGTELHRCIQVEGVIY
jgi:hypothetical protein